MTVLCRQDFFVLKRDTTQKKNHHRQADTRSPPNRQTMKSMCKSLGLGTQRSLARQIIYYNFRVHLPRWKKSSVLMVNFLVCSLSKMKFSGFCVEIIKMLLFRAFMRLYLIFIDSTDLYFPYTMYQWLRANFRKKNEK